ncbi:peroxisomal biogenesis factor 19-like [Lingula anatina]|uniref:Peroxin-19 n=1 Tax=Lingula anatina TaxID=7574 RepID=A0A1S3IQX5_LINAN|nr:peroxisomal biogenesis factor 19-like [Lingula anatina]|eukprot:XP_013400607.1 peroxisomal biogenesis factor 19-like [Lingula anatina]
MEDAMMQMMQVVFAKETMYPPLKGVLEKFSAWYEEHKNTLEQSECERHEKQIKLIGDTCRLYEEETPEDTVEVKKQRLAKIMAVSQEIGALGDLPPEVKKDMPQPKFQAGDMAGCMVM